jgi:catechol 2,3-dioxygenase-like lactoylglutathione lyase family enzyme
VAVVDDLVTAERFYTEILGEVFGFGAVESRYMLSTDELLEAQRRTESRTRVDGEVDSWVSRTPHSNVTVGRAKISLYLAPYHIQEPPPEQLRGAPRLGLSATREQLDRAPAILRSHRIPFEGPVEHPAPSLVSRSIYFRDPAGNFLEICCPI